MKDSTQEILERSGTGFTTCKNCNGILTERYVKKYGRTCPSCRRDTGSKMAWALWGGWK